MGKIELADWLGKTVFHQLGIDLQKSIEDGMTDLISDEQRYGISKYTGRFVMNAPVTVDSDFKR